MDIKANESSYNVETLPDGRTRFTVIPAPPPRLGCHMFIVAGLCALLGGIIFSWTGAFSIVAIGVFGFLGYKFAKTMWHRGVNKRRAPGGVFIVSPDKIETPSGETITRERLHRLVIRNGMEVANQANTVMTHTDAVRNHNVTLATQVSYMLWAEYSGRSVILGGGMTETTANGLMTDASRILGLE